MFLQEFVRLALQLRQKFNYKRRKARAEGQVKPPSDLQFGPRFVPNYAFVHAVPIESPYKTLLSALPPHRIESATNQFVRFELLRRQGR